MNTSVCSRPLGMTSISRTTISARLAPFMLRRECQFEFADAFGFDGELRPTHAAGIDGDGLIGDVIHQAEPVVGLQFQADVAASAGVVVGRDGNGDAVALRERDRQVEVDEKSWKTFRLDVPLPSAPCVVDAIMAMRQVVMESAMGMVMLARRRRSVMISGLI